MVYGQFYWSSRKTAVESAREYVAFEFSSSHADKIMEAINIMEKNHGLSTYRGKGDKDAAIKFSVPEVDHGAKRAYELLTEVDNKLSNNSKKAWRWRILLLRSMFDYELRLSKGVPNDKIKTGFKELSTIYFAKEAEGSVRPPLT